VERLLNSRALKPYPATDLHGEAAMCKCKYAISLPDCHTIALARRLNTRALFMREKELEKVVKKGALADVVQFL
jgi:predicted nucleic acid-binding protein